MKEDFSKLKDIWGISVKEAEELDKRFNSIDELKQALINNSVTFLIDKDIKILKKYFGITEIVSTKNICPTCLRELPDVLDMGICPWCQHRRRPW